jgi:hypothetical protein
MGGHFNITVWKKYALLPGGINYLCLSKVLAIQTLELLFQKKS